MATILLFIQVTYTIITFSIMWILTMYTYYWYTQYNHGSMHVIGTNYDLQSVGIEFNVHEDKLFRRPVNCTLLSLLKTNKCTVHIYSKES